MKTYFTKAKVTGSGLQLALPASTNMQRVLSWIDVINDKAVTTIGIWKAPYSRKSTGANAAGQKAILCSVTAGIVASDVIIIQDAVDPALFEIVLVAAVVANTSYTATSNLTNSYSSGALIYLAKRAGGTSAADWVFDVGIAQVTKENDTAVFVADKNEAILIEHSSATATCSTMVSGFLRD